MSVRFTDEQIAALIAEAKLLPDDWREVMLKHQAITRGGYEQRLAVRGADGHEFVLILNQNRFNALNFSAILAHRPNETTELFRLRRYNGRAHEHTNRIERQTFYDFHIHTATERYQDHDFDEDKYAEPTRRFTELAGALACLTEDCGFVVPPRLSLAYGRRVNDDDLAH